MLNTHESDRCCGKALSKELLSGRLDNASSWVCPKCGETWKPTIQSTIAQGDGAALVAYYRLWRMHPAVMVHRHAH
jgi:hypothetical protein